MIIIGLTGGIASGKSTTAALFRELDIPVHDADAAVHEMMAPGGVATGKVVEAFGGQILAPDGSVDRQRLGGEVFAAPERRRILESIIHPLVAASRDRFLATSRLTGVPLVVLDIPLLFETGGEALCDFVILCSVDPDTQKRRALRRNGMTEDKLAAILQSQMPLATKRAMADAVIETDHGVDAARQALLAILDGPVRQLRETKTGDRRDA
ncbi:MAG: dephospho-CoA kinase [SAR116 cluster bacterium]|jgi:dephospho-CoA kinase|nr:dephospho-CoA kinase [SAR116 cluster bacterium]RPG98811.1 MAG: dephospho-CoA kinase [Candidatus Puniceispirillum sp. TMED176]RZO31233.1 MAG: dephospho-CoA kinase [SAR116 cluster bacterium]|tara:strand:- start:8426 stop:9058 length:633 start_codon:yes stop_codon:yes gene_type:complete